MLFRHPAQLFQMFQKCLVRQMQRRGLFFSGSFKKGKVQVPRCPEEILPFVGMKRGGIFEIVDTVCHLDEQNARLE